MSKKGLLSEGDFIPETIVCCWECYGELCEQLLEEINEGKEDYDLIVAISRGGLPLGTFLSHHLNTEIEVVRAMRADPPVTDDVTVGNFNFEIKGKKILIVDDICDSGDTLIKVVSKILTKGKPKVLHTAVMFQKETARTNATYNAYSIEKDDCKRWVIFPYELNSSE